VANDGDGDPLPPLDAPDESVGGDRMGECGAVLPANAPLPPDKLTAASWVISDQDTGNVLAAYAPHARQRPAGTIKVLLAMVALRELDQNAIIVATREDTQQKLSKIGLVADGKYITGDLIRALIATSASDVANAIARSLGGPDEAVRKMNALAKELKCYDTRAVNPNGTDQPGMSTSAFDIAVIYREAMRIPEFADATGSSSVVIQPQGNRKNKLNRPNDNKSMLENFKGATGGKSGLTDAAKSTFVGSAEKDGKHVVVSIMRSEKQPFDQAASLLTYGFSLLAAHTEPVGKLGATAEPAKTTRDPNAQSSSEKTTLVGSSALARSAFGNFGLPVTIAAGAVVLLGLLMTLRRKMARAKRLRAQQAR
jgi:D-alanyl-D-alanine carboxypeptidase (penicillin-binding protein 5/6)